MEEYSIEEVQEMQKQARRAKRQAMTQAERIAMYYLVASRPQAVHIAYEGLTVIMGDQTYKPDFVVFLPGFRRQYIEVKESAADWQGYRYREARVKLAYLRHLVEPFGHTVHLLTIENGRVKTEVEIMP